MRRNAVRRDELAARREPYVWPVDVPPAAMLARVEARAGQLRRRRAAVFAAPVPVVLVALLIAALAPNVGGVDRVHTTPGADSAPSADPAAAPTPPPAAARLTPPPANRPVPAPPTTAAPTAPVSTTLPAGDELAESDPLPSAGRIAFVRSGAIWVVNADGTGLYPITPTGETFSSPHFGRDGRLVALHHLTGMTRAVVIDVDAGTRKTLPFAGHISVPRFSPDGRWIAFGGPAATSDYNEPEGVWVMRDDGTDARLVTRAGSSPHWTADGKRLMFFGPEGFEIVDVDGRNRRTLSETYFYPKASPQGDRYLAMRSDGMGHWVLDNTDANLQNARQIVDEHNMSFEWSADGRWAAVERRTLNPACFGAVTGVCWASDFNVWLVRADGVGLRQLTFGGNDGQLTFGPPAKRR